METKLIMQDWECPKCEGSNGTACRCINCRGNGSNLAITYATGLDYDKPMGQDVFDGYTQAIQNERITNKLVYLVNQYFQGKITLDELYDKFNEYIAQEIQKELEEYNNETESKS